MYLLSFLIFQNMQLKWSNDSRDKQSPAGRKYFDKFNMHFWKLLNKYEEFF